MKSEYELDMGTRTDEINLELITIEKKLGEGSFGIVFKAHYKGEKIALKIEKNHYELSNEIRILKELSHPSIPKLIGTGLFSGYNFFIIQLYRFNLLQLLKIKDSFFSSKTVACIIWNLLEALEYIHSKGVVYADIKPDNIMIGFDNKVYLIDYGLSQFRCEATSGKFIGTSRYASVNIHKGIKANFTDDIESLGYLSIFLLKKTLPWIDIESKTAIRIAKEDVYIGELCKGLDFNWHVFLKETISYRVIKPIKYQYMKELMTELIENKPINNPVKRFSGNFLCCQSIQTKDTS